jgi:hypothetical protein
MMTPKEQLDLWVQGNSIHNLERNECTPDLSCCKRHLRWSPERRAAYQMATDDVKLSMVVSHLETVIPGCNFTADDEAMVLTAVRDL